LVNSVACSALPTFVSAEVREGVSLSLLLQVMLSRLSRRTCHGGLLSTEARTLARVAADDTITLTEGVLCRVAFLNTMLLPPPFIFLASIVAIMSTYNSLLYQLGGFAELGGVMSPRHGR
jgi:hypothetical protein